MVAPILRPFHYVVHYERNIQELRHELRDVDDTINKVHPALYEAQPWYGSRSYFNSQWLDNINNAKNEAEEALNETAKVEKGWLNGWCPNVISRYRLSQEAENLAGVIAGLIDEAENYLTEVASVPTTRMVHTKAILDALNIDNNNIIGLFGEAGAGKTTEAIYAEAIYAGKRAIQNQSFDEVVIFIVPQGPDDLSSTQSALATTLGIDYNCEFNPKGNARNISNRLSEGGRKLLILVDVCKVFDVTALGIPLEGNCKVIVISKEEGICDQMRCQEKICIMGADRGLWGDFKAGAKEWVNNAGQHSIVKELVFDCRYTVWGKGRALRLREEVEKHIDIVKRTIAATATRNQRMEKNEFRINF